MVAERLTVSQSDIKKMIEVTLLCSVLTVDQLVNQTFLYRFKSELL